jgi:hypothetical protein
VATTAVTRKQATWDAIKSRRWISGYDIEAQGGDLRRLREFRVEGHDIKKRKNVWGEYEYRLAKRAF